VRQGDGWRDCVHSSQSSRPHRGPAHRLLHLMRTGFLAVVPPAVAVKMGLGNDGSRRELRLVLRTRRYGSATRLCLSSLLLLGWRRVWPCDSAGRRRLCRRRRRLCGLRLRDGGLAALIREQVAPIYLRWRTARVQQQHGDEDTDVSTQWATPSKQRMSNPCATCLATTGSAIFGRPHAPPMLSRSVLHRVVS
jgi:hypothetical protein